MKFERIENRILELKKVLRVVDALPDDVRKGEVVAALLGMESYPRECLNTHHEITRQMKSNGYSVYAILLGGIPKVYIGMSYNYPKRIAAHLNALRTHTHKSKTMQQIWDENGFCEKDVKVFIIRSGLTFEEASRTEAAYIELYDAMNPEHGYNTAKGSPLGDVVIIDGAPIIL